MNLKFFNKFIENLSNKINVRKETVLNMPYKNLENLINKTNFIK